MKPWLKYCALGVRSGVSCLGSFVLWTLWLGLTLVLVTQLYIASSSELAVPAFLLRRLEERVAAAGLSVTFGRTSFDPTGRVLVENVRFFLPAFSEPIFTARAVFVRLQPRPLLVGAFEPAEIHVMDAAAGAPAQLTPSGRTEELISELEATLVPQGHDLLVRQLSARFANLTVSAHGRISLPSAGDTSPSRSIAELFTRRFPSLCRQAITLREELARFEQPALHLDIASTAAGAPLIAVTALARQVLVEGPFAAEARDLIATTRLLLHGGALLLPLDLSASDVRLRNGAHARRVTVQAAGRLQPDPLAFDLREATVTVDALSAQGVDARALSARVFPQPLPRLNAEVTARLLDAPIALRTEADLTAGSARVRFDAAISPRVLDVISQRVGTNVRRFFEFDSLKVEAGEAHFGAGWKFERLTARVSVPHANSYGITMEDGRATVELEPGRLYSPEASVRLGENFAHGSYEHNLRTQEFRFLLEGRLQPLVISPWFTAWWPNFFRQLEFPTTPPDASVDVNGVWRQGRRSKVFVYAETPQVIFRGTQLERTRTRLFIRPGFFDGLEVLATGGGGETRGAFTYRANEKNEWNVLGFAGESSFDLALAAQLLGPTGARLLAPYRLATAPAVKISGTLLGPAAPVNSENSLQIEAVTTGEFRFHEFPLQDVSFVAKVKGDDVTIDRFNGTFADGAASGNARVWGRGAERRVGFNVSLDDANLGQAANTLQGFLAQRKGLPPPPPGRFVQERANLRLNVSASAEGAYDNPLNFRGDGNALLKGAGLSEVPLLGLLSELFTFTSLRFTEARGNFKIDGPKLVFPRIELRGANSAIDALGDFALDRRELNFTAKVFPFQESGNVFKTVVGAVLTPLSNVLEVKLSGTLEKPHWAFVMGPANLLRAFAEGGTDPAKPPEPAAPAPPPTPPPAQPTPRAEKP